MVGGQCLPDLDAVGIEGDQNAVCISLYGLILPLLHACMRYQKYWQSRLKILVEAWSGEQLELTDIYGMRRYEDGARLLTHVDREATHAASLIINIAQGAVRKPWKIEIYDFAGRSLCLTYIPMRFTIGMYSNSDRVRVREVEYVCVCFSQAP